MRVKSTSTLIAIAALLVAASGHASVQAGVSSTPATGQANNPSKVDVKAIIDAYEDSGMTAVRMLVRGGADINAVHPGDGTVLMVAAKNGDLSAVNELLILGADVTVSSPDDGTALIAAAGAGHLEVVRSLVAAGAAIDAVVRYDETALITACREGRFDVVKYLVAEKADVNHGVTTPSGQRRTPLNQANTQDIRKFLVAHGARDTRQ